MRKSRRYRKQWTVSLHEYRLGLLRTLREDGAALIDAYGMDKTLRDLEKRLKNQDVRAAWARLTRGILDEAGGGNPMRMSGEAFARAAETHYRDTLRKRHLSEAFLFLENDLKHMESAGAEPLRRLREKGTLPPNRSAADHVRMLEPAVLDDSATQESLHSLLTLMLAALEEGPRP
ncbi:MAG: hypothetical protein BWZ10_03167 [candidate division BRC1 bacterium ADurb.BinA364]|nr:MAG: hypothetical protein BWZ10_03167 [candidate division BRC1 bacterium ADurb.BinA364]